MDQATLNLLRLVLARLERITADSHIAHRASGVRGSLLQILDEIEDGKPANGPRLHLSLENGFAILKLAAKKRVK